MVVKGIEVLNGWLRGRTKCTVCEGREEVSVPGKEKKIRLNFYGNHVVVGGVQTSILATPAKVWGEETRQGAKIVLHPP